MKNFFTFCKWAFRGSLTLIVFAFIFGGLPSWIMILSWFVIGLKIYSVWLDTPEKSPWKWAAYGLIIPAFITVAKYEKFFEGLLNFLISPSMDKIQSMVFAKPIFVLAAFYFGFAAFYMHHELKKTKI